MYLRWCERQGLATEIISESASELGGYKEVVIRVAGEQVYGRLRFESGGHRVQRVPATESQGRIHTSACTVAVMPEADEADEVQLNPADLRIDTFARAAQAVSTSTRPIARSASPTCDRPGGRVPGRPLAAPQQGQGDGGAGGSLARQGATRKEALEAATRKSLVGSGDRSDRIRTYNFPQGRLTDHRINLTLYKLGAVMDGELDDVITALQAARAAEQLAALESGGGIGRG